MTQQLVRPEGRHLTTEVQQPNPPARLDPYGRDGIAAQTGRIAPLAVVSLGYRLAPKSEGALGLPRATRRDDERWLHLHDPDERAPGLKAALEAGNYRRLQIAFPTDRGFIQQSFTRWSASALEIYGDATGLTLIDSRDPKNPQHKLVPAGTPEFDRLVKTCKAETRIMFVLARWEPSEDEEGLPSSELIWPDGFGTYVFRTAGRHTAANIFGYLETISAFTRGRIAGIPFDLEVTFPEVVGPDGKKRTVATATIVMRPPERIKLNSRTFRHFATAGLEEGRNLQLPALPSPEDLALEGPPDIEEIPEDAVKRLAAGDFPCDYNLTVRTWHAIVRGTLLESDESRALWLREWSKGEFESLTAVRELSQREATQMLADLADGVSDVREEIDRQRRADRASEYDRVIGSQYDDVFESKKGGTATEIHHDTEPTRIDQQKVVKGPPQQILGAEADSPATEPEMVKSARSPLMSRLATLLEEAAVMDIATEEFKVKLPAPVVEVETKLAKLGAEIAAMRRQIAGDVDDDDATQVSF